MRKDRQDGRKAVEADGKAEQSELSAGGKNLGPVTSRGLPPVPPSAASSLEPLWVAKWSNSKKRYYYYDERVKPHQTVWKLPEKVSVQKHIGGPPGM